MKVIYYKYKKLYLHTCEARCLEYLKYTFVS